MSRRGENVRKRKDGRWEARYIERLSSGQVRVLSVYAKTYSEVKKKRNKLIQNDKNKRIKAERECIPCLTLNEMMDKWLTCQKNNVRASSYQCYERLIQSHIRPELGDYQIPDITADLLHSYCMKKMECGRMDGSGGLSVNTVKELERIVHSALRYAKLLGQPVREIYRFPIKLPEGNKRALAFTRQEQKRLEAFLNAHMDCGKLGILLCLYTGLRIGEVCGLRWKDIDLELGLLSVRHSVMRLQNRESDRTKTHILLTSPKSASSIRAIPLPAFLLEFLKKMRSTTEDFFVLTDRLRCIEPRSYSNRYKRYLKEAGIRSYPFHSLRHTFATRCIEMGFDPKTLSEILGHSDVKITLRCYVHPTHERKIECMNRLNLLS